MPAGHNRTADRATPWLGVAGRAQRSVTVSSPSSPVARAVPWYYRQYLLPRPPPPPQGLEMVPATTPGPPTTLALCSRAGSTPLVRTRQSSTSGRAQAARRGRGGRAAAAACGAAAAAAAQGRPSSQHNSTTQQVAATDSPRSLDLSNLGFGDHGEALSPASSASTRPGLSPQSPAAAAEATDSSSVHGEGGGGGGSGSAAAAVDPVLAIDLDDEALMHEILSSVEGSATPVRSSPAKSSARSDAAAVGGGGGGGPGAGAGDRGEGGDERSESVLSMASMASSGLSATPEPLDVDEMRRKVDGRIKMLSTGEVMESLMEETLD
eukprot:SAG25_NODE_1601_length_2694_cov_21.238536_2_plen_323_part_00